MSLTDVPPQTLLLDKYRVIGTLGKGGMGCVYEVVHELTHHTRAMKLLHAEMRDTPGAVERFLREASAAGRIGDPHIIDTYDAGVMPTGEAYLVMEMLEGEPLSSVLKHAKKGLPLGLALDLVIQACDGVEAAHRAGIVHRDLKPANLFVVERDGRPFVKVLDFGISKFSDGDLEQLTRAGQLMGTPAYMPPEQFLGKSVDHRADIYALGVILYRAITGKTTYKADSLMQLALLVAEGKYTPASELRPDAPEDIDPIVARCLAREPEDRYSSAKDLADALRKVQAELAEADGAEAVTIALNRPSVAPPADFGSTQSSQTTASQSSHSEVQAPSVAGTERGSHVMFPGAPEPASPAPAKPARRSSSGLVLGAVVAGCLALGAGYALTRPPVAAVTAPGPTKDARATSDGATAPSTSPTASSPAATASSDGASATAALAPPTAASTNAPQSPAKTPTRPAIAATAITPPPPKGGDLATENPYR